MNGNDVCSLKEFIGVWVLGGWDLKGLVLRLGSRFTAILLVMRVDPGHALAAQHPLEGARGAATFAFRCSPCSLCTLILCSLVLCSLVEIA